MLLDFYGFETNPFHPSRDPQFYYASRSHREASALIRRAVEERGGLVVVTGDGACGKTSLLEALKRQEWPDGVISVTFLNPLITFSKLLHSIHERLFPDLTPAPTQNELLGQLTRELSRPSTRHWRVLLLIDEAQHLPPDTAAQLGRLLAIKNSNGRVFQIVLSGQEELNHRLEDERLSHLPALIHSRCEISALEPGEVAAYVDHRIRAALAMDADPEGFFTREALERIGAVSEGRPGRINRYCHEVLTAGARFRERPVSLATARSILPADPEEKRRSPRWLPTLAAAATVFLLVTAGWMAVGRWGKEPLQQSASDRGPAAVPTSSASQPGESPGRSELTNASEATVGEQIDDRTVFVDSGEQAAGASDAALEQRVDTWVNTLSGLESEQAALIVVGAERTPSDAALPGGSTKNGNANQFETPAAEPAIQTAERGATPDGAPRGRQPGTDDTTVRTPLVVTPSEFETLTVAPAPEPGAAITSGAQLSIVSYPAATVLVDGVSIGTTPVMGFKVGAGRHLVEVVSNGRRQVRTEVIREREHRQLSFRFDKEPP